MSIDEKLYETNSVITLEEHKKADFALVTFNKSSTTTIGYILNKNKKISYEFDDNPSVHS